MESPGIKMSSPCYMMATNAIHLLGDISRDEPDLCYVTHEDEENFYGNWITGFGFIHVKFPKSTTRLLNDKEIAYYESRNLVLAGNNLGKIKIYK